MTAQYLNIEAKGRGDIPTPASLADFTTSAGESLDPNIILTDPNISLYCFDDAAQRAIFTELPPDVDLSTAPFVYQMQYERAERLITVSYDTFRQLARRLPEAEHPILIFNSGRSGSTLTSHIFNAVEGTLSLSEPDTITQFVFLRHADRSNDAEMRDLLDCTLRMLFKPTPFIQPTRLAVKFRNQATPLMDLYQATFPGAKNLYIYRDGIGFVTSFYRVFKTLDLPDSMLVGEYLALFEQMTTTDPAPLIAYLDPGTERLSIPEQATLGWIDIIETYLAQYAKGIPVLAVRYDDLNRKREPTVSAILEYCGLPKARAKETLIAFERDAQAGTMLARENPSEGNKLRLTEDEHAAVTRILARHPVIQTSDYVVPGTLQL